MSEYMDAVLKRRSMYMLEGTSTLPDEELEKRLHDLVKNLPTAFNMQSTRLVLLLGENHHKLWSIVLETLRARVPADKFARTEAKIGSFDVGYGTVLFFHDEAESDKLREKFPDYAEHVAPWALQHSGMLQVAVWVMLEDVGLGASLQHYNPIIDDEVKRTWQLPESWQLLAQMPFGRPKAPAGEKEFLDNMDERFKVFK